MNAGVIAGIALTAAGLAGYVAGIAVEYPGRALSLTAIMVGITLALISQGGGEE